MDEAFFRLLRSGLYGTDIDPALLPEHIDWQHILRRAKTQTVTGLIADAIVRLPKDRQPSQEIITGLQAFAIRNVQTHTLLNRGVAEVVKFFADHDIPTILLKGQGIARCYRDPLLRQCGDIDLYVGKKNYAKACDLGLTLLQDKGTKIEINKKHTEFEHNHIPIELHRIAARMYVPWLSKDFEKWMVEQLEQQYAELPAEEFYHVKVKVPPLEFNLVFLFYHLWNHFIFGGIGLRQLCDLTMLIHAHHSQIDRAQLTATLKRFGLLRQWHIIAYILVNKLGLPEEEMPVYSADASDDSAEMLDIILSEGNFGQFTADGRMQKRPPKNYFKRKVWRLKKMYKETRLKMKFDPARKIFVDISQFSDASRNVLLKIIGKK